MTAPNVGIGDRVAHVDTLDGYRLVRYAFLVGETRTCWIDDTGWKWRKTNGEAYPRSAGCGPRRIMSIAEFEAAVKS